MKKANLQFDVTSKFDETFNKNSYECWKFIGSFGFLQDASAGLDHTLD